MKLSNTIMTWKSKPHKPLSISLWSSQTYTTPQNRQFFATLYSPPPSLQNPFLQITNWSKPVSLFLPKMQDSGLGMMGSGGGGGLSGGGGDDHAHQLKAEIATHPLYEQLLSAHVSCLRVATPIDQLPLIDAQLSQSHHLLRSYASHQQQRGHSLSPHERQELDNFLV